MRNRKTQKTIYTALAIIIVPAFVLWGVFTNKDKGPGHASTLARLGNKSITIKEYLDSYRSIQHELMLIYGERAGQVSKYVNIKGEAWDRILLLDYAKKENIKTSDKEVVAWVTTQPAFLRNGVFDDDLYKRYVREYFRLETRTFEEEIRGFLTLDKLREKMRSEIQLSDDEIKALYNSLHGKRDIEYLVIPSESEEKNVLVAEEEITQIYPSLKDQLKNPKKIRIRYLALPKDTPNQEAILAQKSTLKETAEKFSLPVMETEFFSRNSAIPQLGLLPELTEAAFSLSPNEESEWISFDSASYKIALIEEEAEKTLSLDEAKTQIKTLLLKHKAINVVQKKLEAFKEKMEKSSLEAALGESGLATQNAKEIREDAYISGIGPAKLIWPSLDNLKEGQWSEVLPVPTGAAMVHLLKTWPADPANFDKAKSEFRETMIRKKTSEAMGKLLEKLRADLKLNLETMKQIFSEESPDSI